MDFIFFDIWTAEAKKFLLNQTLNSIKKERDKYFFSFSSYDKLVVSLFSADPLCFCADTGLASGNPSSFLQTIMQHLSKNKLIKIEIVDNDRIIYFTFEQIDIYGTRRRHLLICELIPRYENIILTSENPNKEWLIIDSHKRVTFRESRYRQILPGMSYTPPPLLENPTSLLYQRMNSSRMWARNFLAPGRNLPSNSAMCQNFFLLSLLLKRPLTSSCPL